MNRMEPSPACRICLITDVKLYDMDKYKLKSTYEDLCGSNFHLSISPQFTCVYCSALLKKFASFKVKCEQARQLLEFLSNEDIQISSATNIDTIKSNIAHPYKLHEVHNIDSTLAAIKDEYTELDENEANYIDSKEFFTDFNYKCDSDDEPLAKKIKTKRKSVKNYTLNHVKTEIDYDEIPTDDFEDQSNVENFDDSNQEGKDRNLEINRDSNSENNKVSNIEDSKKVVIANWEFDLVILTKEQQIEEVLSRKETSNYINSRYKCNYCYKGFMTEITYKNHMILHNESMGPHSCAICQSRWPTARALTAHAGTHSRRYLCRVCAHVDKSQQRAKEHAQWHRGHKYTCQVCGASFQRSTTLLTHVRVRHSRGDAAAACDACGAVFIGEIGLSIHKKKAHRFDRNRCTTPEVCARRDGGKYRPFRSFSLPSTLKANLESTAECSECGSCGAKFKNEAALKRHRELATSDICDTKLSWCEHCGESCLSVELYREHVKIHQSSPTLTCDECSSTFSTERSLSAHVGRAHGSASGPRTCCVCELCGHTCNSRSLLAAHQRTHSGERPYHCGLCSKRFNKQQLLQIHMRTHTGERPFQCATCPKAFKHKAALNRHDRVHTGLRPYRCATCGKTFSQSNSMKQHAAAVHMKAPLYARKNKQIDFIV